MQINQRYAQVLDFFARSMPEAKTELIYNSTFQLLVAVMLSAQCTDKRVNLVTPALFKAFPDVASLAHASVADVLLLIASVSYPNAKAAHLVQMAQKVVRDFGGVVPNTREELMSLPGVGRKTANVMLIVAFGKPAMPVDTHVFRVSARLGLVHNCKTPEQTEEQLIRHIPQEMLGMAHHWLILFGRYTCKAVKPLCGSCQLSHLCSYVSASSAGLLRK